MKTAALDIGDVWTGIALSDALGITAKPYKTVTTNTLESELKNIISQELISTIVVGLPKTMRGTESQQTEKVRTTFAELERTFPDVTWKLWDERLSSKRAQNLKKPLTKEDKLQIHAIAAAFILSSYLSFIS